MRSDIQRDLLVIAVLVLTSLCISRSMYLSVASYLDDPESQTDLLSYQHSPDDPWLPPFQ